MVSNMKFFTLLSLFCSIVWSVSASSSYQNTAFQSVYQNFGKILTSSVSSWSSSDPSWSLFESRDTVVDTIPYITGAATTDVTDSDNVYNAIVSFSQSLEDLGLDDMATSLGNSIMSMSLGQPQLINVVTGSTVPTSQASSVESAQTAKSTAFNSDSYATFQVSTIYSLPSAVSTLIFPDSTVSVTSPQSVSESFTQHVSSDSITITVTVASSTPVALQVIPVPDSQFGTESYSTKVLPVTERSYESETVTNPVNSQTETVLLPEFSLGTETITVPSDSWQTKTVYVPDQSWEIETVPVPSHTSEYETILVPSHSSEIETFTVPGHSSDVETVPNQSWTTETITIPSDDSKTVTILVSSTDLIQQSTVELTIPTSESVPVTIASTVDSFKVPIQSSKTNTVYFPVSKSETVALTVSSKDATIKKSAIPVQVSSPSIVVSVPSSSVPVPFTVHSSVVVSTVHSTVETLPSVVDTDEYSLLTIPSTDHSELVTLSNSETKTLLISVLSKETLTVTVDSDQVLESDHETIPSVSISTVPDSQVMTAKLSSVSSPVSVPASVQVPVSVSEHSSQVETVKLTVPSSEKVTVNVVTRPISSHQSNVVPVPVPSVSVQVPSSVHVSSTKVSPVVTITVPNSKIVTIPESEQTVSVPVTSKSETVVVPVPSPQTLTLQVSSHHLSVTKQAPSVIVPDQTVPSVSVLTNHTPTSSALNTCPDNVVGASCSQDSAGDECQTDSLTCICTHSVSMSISAFAWSCGSS